jgi:cyclophilin family peptidyl-prolyl cis-trans isomerase
LLFALAAVAVFGGLAAAVSLRPEKGRKSDSVVILETSLGTIKLQLFPNQAPLTVKNFLRYVDDRFYDGQVFHRVIPGFMIQGGGLLPGLKEKKTRPPVKNEAGNGLPNVRGTLALARTTDPDSGTCQFFINLKDNAFLDRANAPDRAGYCVFGRVIEGMDVVDRIAGVATGGQGAHQNVPQVDVIIKSARRARK